MMENKKLFKQMLDFQKAAFDNSFNVLSKFQEQNEKMVDMFMTQSPWLPEEGKKLINEWTKAYQKGREEFKKIADENYDKVIGFLEKMDDKA